MLHARLTRLSIQAENKKDFTMNLEPIQNKIYEIRGVKVMLDFDLAGLYQVETRVLNQSVKRNIRRFPDDFMFQLTTQEFNNLMSQFVMSSWGGKRKLPYAFTEQGVAMLSGLLNSEVAIAANIKIMRAFVAVRHFVLSMPNEAKIQQLATTIDEILQRQDKMDELVYNELGKVYEAINCLAEQKKLQEAKPRNKIGFVFPHENKV